MAIYRADIFFCGGALSCLLALYIGLRLPCDTYNTVYLTAESPSLIYISLRLSYWRPTLSRRGC